MPELDHTQIHELIERAAEFLERAYAPYSKYKVGAAVLTESGEVFGGCNVENASYGLTICAERNAIAAAVANGQRAFKAIAVVTSDKVMPSPCGACRQFMVEFNPNMVVILANGSGEIRVRDARDLLPEFFMLEE